MVIEDYRVIESSKQSLYGTEKGTGPRCCTNSHMLRSVDDSTFLSTFFEAYQLIVGCELVLHCANSASFAASTRKVRARLFS